MSRALGFTIPAQATCPPCSYLSEGHCLICDDDDPHPGCQGCVDGAPLPPPWYKSELILAITSAVIVSIAVAMIVPRIEKAIGSR